MESSNEEKTHINLQIKFLKRNSDYQQSFSLFDQIFKLIFSILKTADWFPQECHPVKPRPGYSRVDRNYQVQDMELVFKHKLPSRLDIFTYMYIYIQQPHLIIQK